MCPADKVSIIKLFFFLQIGTNTRKHAQTQVGYWFFLWTALSLWAEEERNCSVS